MSRITISNYLRVQQTERHTYRHRDFAEFFTNTIFHDTPQVEVSVRAIRNSFSVFFHFALRWFCDGWNLKKSDFDDLRNVFCGDNERKSKHDDFQKTV